jgi:hypothetical protein
MFNEEETDLTEDERTAFAALPRERVPGDLLEERVVRELRTAGMFSRSNAESRSRSRIASFALRAAAAVVLFAAGVLTERFFSARTNESETAPISAKAVQQKPLPAQRAQPSTVAQLELWI